MPFRFEGLEIWHMSRKFSNAIYKATGKFPDYERYGLATQMTRAANSVCLNIAEGAGRETPANFKRFLSIAVGSAAEVASALMLAMDQNYIDAETYHALYEQADHLSRSINRFRATPNSK